MGWPLIASFASNKDRKDASKLSETCSERFVASLGDRDKLKIAKQLRNP